MLPTSLIRARTKGAIFPSLWPNASLLRSPVAAPVTKATTAIPKDTWVADKTLLSLDIPSRGYLVDDRSYLGVPAPWVLT